MNPQELEKYILEKAQFIKDSTYHDCIVVHQGNNSFALINTEIMAIFTMTATTLDYRDSSFNKYIYSPLAKITVEGKNQTLELEQGETIRFEDGTFIKSMINIDEFLDVFAKDFYPYVINTGHKGASFLKSSITDIGLN